jgi:hypothetical protein
MAEPCAVPVFVLFATECAGTITLDFVLAEDAERSDGSRVSAGHPFAASFTHLPGFPMSRTMKTLEQWAARSRPVDAVSGIDARARHLLLLRQDDHEVVLEYS